MTRYSHYIKPATQARWPARILCVAADGEWFSGGEGRRWDFEELTGWTCSQLIRSGERYTTAGIVTQDTAVDWWEYLAEYTADTRYTWIISPNCRRTWALLGLWEALERGDVSIIDPDYRSPKGTSRQVRDVRESMRGQLAGCSAGSLSRLQDRRSGLLVLQSPPCIARIRCKGRAGSVTWVDTRNYGVDAPAGLGDSGRTVSWLTTFVEGLCAALRATKLGGLKATAGSQAMHGFRYGHYTGGIYCHAHTEAMETESEGYYGGRCECYRIGAIDAPLYHVDIRSSYASCCHSERVPVRLRRVLPAGISAERAVREEPLRCIARVTIETDEAAYPYRRCHSDRDCHDSTALQPRGPVKPSDTDIIFPIGRLATVLCGPELADAVERGRVKTVHSVNYYDTDYALRDYANAVYALRCDAERRGHSEISQYAKRLLVSLPGKFGQRECRWVNAEEIPADIPYGEWYGTDANGDVVRLRSVAFSVQREERLGWSYDASPAIAAWITSAGRIALLTLIRRAGWSGTYYCDTDSLMVDEVGYGQLRGEIDTNDPRLGGPYRKSGPNKVDIRGVKHYVEGTNVVCSGLPGRDIEVTGDSQTYWYYDTPSGSIRRRRRPESTRYLGYYARGAEYTGRNVCADGSTRPIEIWES